MTSGTTVRSFIFSVPQTNARRMLGKLCALLDPAATSLSVHLGRKDQPSAAGWMLCATTPIPYTMSLGDAFAWLRVLRNRMRHLLAPRSSSCIAIAEWNERGCRYQRVETQIGSRKTTCQRLQSAAFSSFPD